MAGQRAGESAEQRAGWPAGRRAGGRSAAEGKTGGTSRGNNESLALGLGAKRGSVDGAHLPALSVRRAAFDGRHVRRLALGAQRTLDARCAALGAQHSALSRVRCSRASGARQTALNH